MVRLLIEIQKMEETLLSVVRKRFVEAEGPWHRQGLGWIQVVN